MQPLLRSDEFKIWRPCLARLFYLVIHKDKVVLRPQPSFLSKFVSAFHINEDIGFTILMPSAGELEGGHVTFPGRGASPMGVLVCYGSVPEIGLTVLVSDWS